MPPIVISSQGPPASSAQRFLSEQPAPFPPTEDDSPLLKSIKAALRRPWTDDKPSVRTSKYFTGAHDPEPEITWNRNRAVLSYGPVMVRSWSFTNEEDSIQYACIADFKQIIQDKSNLIPRSASLGGNTDPKDMFEPIANIKNNLDTFGPFDRVMKTKEYDHGHTEIVPGVFIFLRNLARIYLFNGIDYELALPFLVRKAWPVSPHGLMVQRILDPTEFTDAEATEEDVLPTIFSITTAFMEPAAVGFTSGIFNAAPNVPPTLKDEAENSTKPLKSIPPSELIVFVSHCSVISSTRIVVTVDVEKRLLSIWQYVYIQPNDTPVPFPRQTKPDVPKAHSKRQSISSRRTSSLFDIGDRRDRFQPPLSPSIRGRESRHSINTSEQPHHLLTPSLPAIPTMASIMSAAENGERAHVLSPDLSRTMAGMALGAGSKSEIIVPEEVERMKATYWMQSMFTRQIPEADAEAWEKIEVSLFDDRFDGKQSRCLMSICFPHSKSLTIFNLAQNSDRTMEVTSTMDIPALSATSLRATRANVWDLLVVQPSGGLSLYTHGLCELPIAVEQTIMKPKSSSPGAMDVDTPHGDSHGPIVAVLDATWGTTSLVHEDGYKTSVTFDIFPQDKLVLDCFQLLALILPAEVTFQLHRAFLEMWSAHAWSTAENVEFDCFRTSLFATFKLAFEKKKTESDPWLRLATSESHRHFAEDPVLSRLRKPPNQPPRRPIHQPEPPHKLLAPLLYGLHILAEHLRLLVPRQQDLLKLAPVVYRIAISVRPEWADYWKRLIPETTGTWPLAKESPAEYMDDRIPVWPTDLSAILYGQVSTPDWKAPWHDVQHIVTRFSITPSLEYGVCDPLHDLHQLSLLYNALSDGKITNCQERAEKVVLQMVTQNGKQDLPSLLPLGIAAPLREATRTCQLAPPGNWPLEAYKAIGRNDLAASAKQDDGVLNYDAYKSRKQFINPSNPRESIGEIAAETRTMAGDMDPSSGVDLNLAEFTNIRFGLDRRLEEVARMLCSSTIPSIKTVERPELNELDQAKELQNQVIRVVERTLALPYGRAMFTFGSIADVSREAFAVPKIEYAVRFLPSNTLISPEPGKISADSIAWGEFHNGVAAGLRVSSAAGGVDSSWISFNKPTELSPEHAGLLLALGLAGHLNELMGWTTFQYLTPKHDLTSIGLLLGMAATNVGTGHAQVTRILAVHAPSLLPTPEVELNVTLQIQAAALCGVGLTYLGTKNRRMAEACFEQITRKEVVIPEISNEYREMYTLSAGLALGMIMLGRGAPIPADDMILQKLAVLVQSDTDIMKGPFTKSLFDINLTSPAATIALGLMYLRTGRKDVADVISIPDTVIALNAIQPSFILIRTIARSLILWDAIAPSTEWLVKQIPRSILKAIENRSKNGATVDDSMELAYYNIIAGGCFAVGLKYAGTARQEAYQLIVKHFDHYSRLAYGSGPAFDNKIKRSAVRDGLNLIALALSMVMASTGEITCLRRIRYAFGLSQQMMYHHGFKYSVHVSTHMALGLLFLGGGRYTLGTSNAAIAAMVIAFYPRFSHSSADNRGYLQALRHLWALAVEPRCLIARDVDTDEIVYLPVKIKIQDGNNVETTQLISPTLIPDMDKLMSIRVDTPRYWPFYLDTSAHPRHKEALLRSQTLYVKRRTAFLSYTEDPRGSRSLFVRSGSSSGDSATLDFPQLTDTKTHPAGDLSEFISSFSNNVLFLAFADHFVQEKDDDDTPEERLFRTYSHAALLDSILQDKPQTLQSHLTLYSYRNLTPKSQYFHLRLQDLRFAADFYAKVYERRFSGRTENNGRPSLIRDTTVQGTLHALDSKLDEIRLLPGFLEYMGRYARGESLAGVDLGVDLGDGNELGPETLERYLAWYLLRNGVPVSTFLVILRQLARDAHAQCINLPPPDGTSDVQALDQGIKEVLHATGIRMSTTLGSGWSVRSLNEIIEAWKIA